ncbi:hypothetical protein D3C87_1763480 [compost metagenome]
MRPMGTIKCTWVLGGKKIRYYCTLISRPRVASDFGKVTLKTPFSKAALIFSASTWPGKVNVRMKCP